MSATPWTELAQRPVDALVPYVAGRLRQPHVTYFPVRHHSPACAKHLMNWIREHRPVTVVIEGPPAANALIPGLVDAGCVSPVALYTQFIDQKNRLGVPGLFGPARFSAFYPFCDYSPEWVALREGHKVGAKIRFADLEFAQSLLIRSQPTAEDQPSPSTDGELTAGDDSEPDDEDSSLNHRPAKPTWDKPESLAADALVNYSEYVRRLAVTLGCRDANEVWDSLFEQQAELLTTPAFMDRIIAYCAMARLSYSPQRFADDATDAREAAMALAIRDELRHASGRGPVLVVTGGFHSVVLPDLVESTAPLATASSVSAEEMGCWLVRYSFNQLDALSGYASGMPQPEYYDRLWRATSHLADADEARHIRRSAIAELIVEIALETRQRQFVPAATTPDVIAALSMTEQLAAMRGHAWPTRDDMVDGMRACFVKGELASEGRPVLALIESHLAGDRVGQVPHGTALPPIVADFHAEARRYKLPIDTIQAKKVDLDIYREPKHRDVSRLLRRLDWLNCTYGGLLGGPDFAAGTGLELLIEHWELRWSPTVDSQLIDQAVLGTTIRDAAVARWLRAVASLEETGQARNAVPAVKLLIQACQMGLHDYLSSLAPVIEQVLAEDPSFVTLVTALGDLILLWRSREPLEASLVPRLPQLVEVGWHRACYLLETLAACPDDAVEPNLQALTSLCGLLGDLTTDAGQAADIPLTYDTEMFFAGVWRILETPADQAQAVMIGAALGVLRGEGRISDDDVEKRMAGFIDGSFTAPAKLAGFVRGLIATAREIAWQHGALIRTLDQRFESWDENTFLDTLPNLRLAFADLTPREINQVASAVVDDDGGIAHLVDSSITETDILLAAEVRLLVNQTLAADAQRFGLHNRDRGLPEVTQSDLTNVPETTR